MPHRVLTPSFFARECPEVSADLIGKWLCRRLEDGRILRLQITETEAYCGESDTACHAHRGRTRRTEVLYGPAGVLYVYLCYGIHWMLNIVTGEPEHPQAVLIRACRDAQGPGRLTKALSLTGEFDRMKLSDDTAPLWLEDDGLSYACTSAPRVGIAYASPEDQARNWRFILRETR
ncbi:MAG: DNA-3-methyladenine glycosylase [Oscillospiraceae bacterium]|nr:DNA-3-methyladenine glycosylase [Oscillospiraceae bacterium]